MVSETVESATSFQRFVLLGVVELHDRDETPARSYEVREHCAGRVEDLPAEPFGGITREEVIRTLSVLEAEGVLTEEVDDQSPVGKGRPSYALAVDADAVREALAADDTVGDLVQ